MEMIGTNFNTIVVRKRLEKKEQREKKRMPRKTIIKRKILCGSEGTDENEWETVTVLL